MYVFVVSISLLSLFSLSQAAPLDCKEITTPLTLDKDNKNVIGEWIFYEGASDHHLFTNVLKAVNSLWVKVGLSEHASILTLSQGKMLQGTCQFVTINTTVKNHTIFVSGDNTTTTEGRFLPSCSECATINFISRFKNETINSLYLFKRKSNPAEFDMEMYWKQAECLGIKRETQFTYDGVTEFCENEAKDSSSDQKSTLDKSDQ